MRSLWLAPAALVAAAGCFATKQDVRLLQDEIRAVNASVTTADAARQRQLDSLVQLSGRQRDSLRVLSDRLANFQATMSGQVYEIGRQMIAMEEQLGQSARRIQELRAAWEERAQAAAQAQSDSARQAAGPGPAQLYIAALDQFRRGAYSVARTGFQQLLTQYPTFDDAPLAQLYIGESFAMEKNNTAADSVYQLVTTTYPTSAQAATALYKRALLLRAAGRQAEARTVLQRIVREYPRSDEATLARDLLAAPRR